MIIGKGHLGKFLAEKLCAYHWKDPIENIDSSVLEDEKPGIIINAAGKTDLVWCENNAAETIQANIIAPVKLHLLCVKHNINLIHLSSGCVWDGPYNEEGKPFQPTNPVTPACIYSWSKAACDSLMLHNSKNNILILRPRQVYSPVRSQRNTLEKLIKYKSLLDTPNTMTSAETIAKTILKAIENFPSGRIMNVFDVGVSSPFKVAKMLAAAGLREEPSLLSKSELDTWHKPKRVDAVLDDQFFIQLVSPPNIEDEMARNITEFARNS